MAKASFRGANTNPQDSGPALQSDQSQKILRRSQQYIDGLKRVRDAELEYKKTWLRDFNQGFDDRQRRLDQQNAERQRQASAVAEGYIASLQSQQRRAQSITGRAGNIQGEDPNTDSWLNFVVGASETAAKMYEAYKTEKDKIDFDQAVAKGMMFPQTYDGLAFNKMSANADIMSMNSSAYAAALQAGGADPELVESVRAANPRQLQGIKYAQSILAGKQAVPEFRKQVSSGQSDFIVKYNDGSGTLQEIPLGQIDQSNTDQMTTAFYQWIGDYYRNLGFQDTNTQFLQEGLTYASNAWDREAGSIRNKEIKTNNANRVDGVRQKAFATKMPTDWSMYYFELTTTGGSTDAEARTTLFQDMVNGGLTVTEAEQLGASLTFPDQPSKPVGERFKQEFQDQVINAIKDKEQQQVSIRMREVTAADNTIYLGLRDSFLKDKTNDGDIDVTNEQLEMMAAENESMGFTKSAAFIRQQIAYTEDSKNDEKVTSFVTEQLEQGLPVNEQYIMAQPMSRKAKVALIKKIQQENPANASKDEIKQFKDQFAVELKSRINYVDSTKVAPGSLARAQAQAVADFKLRYRQFRIAGDVPAVAFDKASAMFSEELGEDPTKGTYALSGVTKDEDGLIKFDVDEMGDFANFGLPTATESYESGDSIINKYLNRNGAAAIGTIPVAPQPVVNNVKQQMKLGKMITVPSFYNKLSEKMPGVPPYVLFASDMQAHGVELPENTFDVQKKADQEVLAGINPIYQSVVNQMLYYRNNSTRTDIGVVTSGQDAIYSQSTPAQNRIKAIFSLRESPQAGYDAINRGRGGDTPGGATARYGRPLTSMTLGEVKQLQAQELNAVGKYQFIESTLAEAAIDAGVTDDMLFNEAVQDRIFFVHLDKHGAYGPWERWWIEQGGPHLALSPEEKALIEAFRQSYDPSKPWGNARNKRPELLTQ